DSLNRSEAAVANGQVDVALNEYQNAVDAVKDADALILKAGVRSAGGATDLFLAPFLTLPEGSEFQTPKTVPSVARQSRTAAAIDKLIRRYDVWFNLVVLVISSVIGLSVLWINDPVWGGLKSYVTAVLWGLGIQQAGGAALDGLPAITKRLTE